MKNKWKSYNRKLLFVFFGILMFIVISSIVIDPFNIFNFPKIKYFNELKPDKDRNQRITKIVGLKLEKKPLQSVFLGSSRVNSSIDETYYKKLTQKNTKNLGMNALSHDETFKIAKHVILVHPEIETIYVGLDFFRFLERNKDNKRNVILSSSKKLTISELNPLLLSFNTIIASVNTVRTNIKYRNFKPVETDKTDFFIKKLEQYSNNYENASLDENEILKFKLFKQKMEKSGYNVVFYINPTHISDIALIQKMGYLDIFHLWKEKLADNFNYIDFDFVNEMTEEEINKDTKYFLECSHSSYLMGNLILEKLILDNNQYGFYVTAENIKKHNKENKKALLKWEKENSFWSKEIDRIVSNEE